MDAYTQAIKGAIESLPHCWQRDALRCLFESSQEGKEPAMRGLDRMKGYGPELWALYHKGLSQRHLCDAVYVLLTEAILA